MRGWNNGMHWNYLARCRDGAGLRVFVRDVHQKHLVKKVVYVATDAFVMCIFLAAAVLWGFGFEEPTRFLAASASCFAALHWLKILGRDLDA